MHLHSMQSPASPASTAHSGPHAAMHSRFGSLTPVPEDDPKALS